MMNESIPGLSGFREKKLEVTVAVQSLSSLARKIGATSLAERVEKELVEKLEEDRFHLVVVGEFNHGKSTFVNALLGEVVLAVGVTPTTAAIHHIRYAVAPEATVVFASGKRESLPFGEVRSFAAGGAREAGEEVEYIEIGHPAPLLEERIVLVDTPGVNDLSLQRSDITYSYIPRADAVLFLLDAGQILKESERVFLEEKLLRASRDKIVFVITKWDLLSESERVEALAYAKAQLAKLVPAPVVFAVSAERALAGDLAASGIPQLVSHLTRFLSEERGRILLDNALGEALGASVTLSKGIDARRRALAMSHEEIERRIKVLEADLAGQSGTLDQRRSHIREEVSGIKVGARKDLERFVDEVIRQLPNVIDAAKADTLKSYLPGFLEDTFREWGEAQTLEIGGQLERLAERTIALVREDAHDATRRVGAALGADVKRLDVSVDTFNYDAGVSALLVIGIGTLFVNLMLGGVLIAAAPVVAYMLRGRIEGEYRKRAKELAPAVVRAAAEKVGPKLDELVDAFAAKLDAWVVTASEELYREVLEVLRGARDLRFRGDVDEGALAAEIEAEASALASGVASLERMRSMLWTPGGRVRVAQSEAAS